MDIIEPKSEEAFYGLRAMKMVAQASEKGLGDYERNLLAAAQKVVLHTNFDVDSLTPISPEELANHFENQDLRHQLVQGMIVMSIVDGPATHEQVALISSFAKTLEVDEPAVKVNQELAERELLLFRLDFYRQSQLVDYLKNQYHQYGGIIGVAKALLGFKGLVEDKELAARFRALGDLPENTLGYAFFQHYTKNGFAFPGEKGGFPLGAVYHDFTHVLSGHSITREGEMLNGAFQAGYRRNKNAFFIILFVVLSQSSGVNMTPVDMPPTLGRLGKGDLAERFLKEIKRGSSMNTDLGDDWDFWEYVDLPLDEARTKLGVLPKE